MIEWLLERERADEIARYLLKQTLASQLILVEKGICTLEELESARARAQSECEQVWAAQRDELLKGKK
jgi:hypothetical protein